MFWLQGLAIRRIPKKPRRVPPTERTLIGS
jgi:hypothetical protein